MSQSQINKTALSIVIPAHNESKNIPIVVKKLVFTLSNMGITYDIIIVDDGSTDDTAAVLEATIKEYEGVVRGIFLSRNFGHQAALNAGVDNAFGSAIVVMDADLQHPPEVIPLLYAKYLDGADIVLGVRSENKQNSFFREQIGKIFYSMINSLSELELHSNVADFGLYSERAICALRQLPEKDRFLRGLVQWIGYKKSLVEYTADKRMFGVSKYTYRKLLKLALTGITSFSAFPLRLSWWLGLFMMTISGIYILFILYTALVLRASFPPGWVSLMMVILLVSSFQFIILGILGEYIYRIFYEVKARPIYIIRKQVGYEKLPQKSLYGIRSDL